jgi:DNA-binding protein H-NS
MNRQRDFNLYNHPFDDYRGGRASADYASKQQEYYALKVELLQKELREKEAKEREQHKKEQEEYAKYVEHLKEENRALSEKLKAQGDEPTSVLQGRRDIRMETEDRNDSEILLGYAKNLLK